MYILYIVMYILYISRSIPCRMSLVSAPTIAVWWRAATTLCSFAGAGGATCHLRHWLCLPSRKPVLRRVSGWPAEPVCRTPSLHPPGVDRVDSFSAAMTRLKTGVGCLRFGYLCCVMMPLLCLPNSNADSKRVFSMVKKIQTDCRSDLRQDTICGLLTCKLNNDWLSAVSRVAESSEVGHMELCASTPVVLLLRLCTVMCTD